MKRRLWVLIAVFTASLVLGFYGPIFFANRKVELELRAWYRDALAEPPPWEFTDADESLQEELMGLRTKLEEAWEASELSLDSFPTATVTRALEAESFEDMERVDRDIAPYLDALGAIVGPNASLLRSSDRRIGRFPEIRVLDDVRTYMDFTATHVWVGLLVFAAATSSDADEQAGHLGNALDLARLADNGSLVGFLGRCYFENQVFESVHLLLKERLEQAGLASALREELEARLVRSGRTWEAAQPLVSERQLMKESFAAFMGEEPICAGFSGDLKPLLDVVHDLERAQGIAELEPVEYLERMRSDTSPSPSNMMFEDYLESMHAQRALILMLRVELALASFREAEGDWPDDLAALASLFQDGVPVDPHSGGPLPYERTGVGIRLGPPAISAVLERGEELVRVLP